MHVEYKKNSKNIIVIYILNRRFEYFAYVPMSVKRKQIVWKIKRYHAIGIPKSCLKTESNHLTNKWRREIYAKMFYCIELIIFVTPLPKTEYN